MNLMVIIPNLSSSFYDFLYKKWFHQILLIFYNCKCIFGGGYIIWPCRRVSRERWRYAGVGRSSSIWPNSRILIENPLAGSKKIDKKWFSWFHFNGKMHSTMLDWVHYAESKIWQTFLLLLLLWLWLKIWPFYNS